MVYLVDIERQIIQIFFTLLLVGYHICICSTTHYIPSIKKMLINAHKMKQFKFQTSDSLQNIPDQSHQHRKEEENVYDPSSSSYSTETDINQVIKEETCEEQGFDDSNLDTDNLVDCSEHV